MNDNTNLFLRAVYIATLYLFPIFIISSLIIAGVKDVEIKPIDRLKVEKDRLITIQNEIKDLGEQVNTFQSQENSLLEQVEKYQLIYNLRDAELRGINQKLLFTQLEIDKLKSEIPSLEDSIEENIEYLRARMRTMYKLGNLNYLRMLLSLQSPAQIKKGMWYLSRLTEEDRNRILKLEDDYKDHESKLKEVKSKYDNINSLKVLSEKKKNQIQEILESKKDLLTEIQESKNSRMKALDELQKASDQMEKLIIDISKGRIDLNTKINIDITPFISLLDLPVSGKIIKKFGSEVHPIFKTKIPHNGFTFSVEKGSPVNSIFSGVVIFNKRFRGYGNMIIIDHGNGYMSFYAHLHRSLVREGANVYKNQEIALSGESGSLEGPKLYFEIRKDGKPVDPMIWFKLKE